MTSTTNGVKLLVRYNENDFTPDLSRSEVTYEGKYEWANIDRRIKCLIPGLKAGWTTFEAVRDKLQPLFKKGVIREILQCRGDKMVLVTSLDDDEVGSKFMENEYSIDGRTGTWEDAGEPDWSLFIHEGGRIRLCAGGRRTVLVLSSKYMS